MFNTLKNLELRDWYHIMIVIGFTLLLLSLTIQLIGVDNNVIQLASVGLITYGLGEVINHPYQERIDFLPDGTPLHGKGYKRKNNLLGLFFILIAIIFFSLSAYKLIF